MKKAVGQISFVVLLFSVLIYIFGRYIIRGLISDDTGDWFLWAGAISAALLFFFRIGKAGVDVRRGINLSVGCVIVFLSAFGMWGLFTADGKRQFGEMAALMPFFALLCGGGLLLMLVVVNIIWRRRLKQNK